MINEFLGYISTYSTSIIIALIGIVLILFIWLISVSCKLKKMTKKYNHFTSGNDGQNVEDVLNSWIDKLQSLEKNNLTVNNELDKIKEMQKSCLQKASIIRYNPFEKMGGDFCFVITLLDGKDNGIILNGLHSRDGSYVYAKPVVNGVSKYQLSEEETESLKEAISS